MAVDNQPSTPLQAHRRQRQLLAHTSHGLWQQSQQLLQAATHGRQPHTSLGTPTAHNRYGLLRVHLGFSNFSFCCTTLEGRVLRWLNGGSDVGHSKRTRMTSRSVLHYLDRFMQEGLAARLQQRGILYLKVLFLGPSRRFRAKIYGGIRKQSAVVGVQVLCQQEGYRRSFNGCRKARPKR